MSETLPGSRAWWIETALIAGSGIAFALLLWDGPIWQAPPSALPAAQDTETAATAPDQQPRTLADFVDAGCLTQDHLRALVEGSRISIACPAEAAP